MPALDMPIEELLKYQGSSPCPADFDEYWDEALAEMNSIDPAYELIPVNYPSKACDMYDLFFTGTKNARIHARVAIPKNIEGKIPAVLGFHGLSGRADAWCDLLRFACQGHVCAYLDARGQGGSSQNVGGYSGTTHCTEFMRGVEDENKNNLYYRDVFLDTALMAKIIMSFDFVDENRVGTYGGSQGGALAIACACLVPKIKKCAPWAPYLSDYKRVYNMDLNKDAYSGLAYFFRQRDPAHKRENEVFERLGYIDIQNLAKRMKADLLLQTGLVDNICPPSTQFAMYNKVTSNKRVITYPEYAHEIPGDGYDIVFEFFAEL